MTSTSDPLVSVPRVSSVINPVGPQPPAVYWRRRLLVALGIVVVLILLFVLFSGGSDGDGQTPVAATSPSASPAPNSSTSSSAGSTITASPSSTATGDLATMPECADSDIQVVASVDQTTFSVGTPIKFTMKITNNSDQTCKRNVGPKVNTISVSSGPAHVWSSDDCSPAGGDQVVAIPPGGSWGVNATWDQKLTDSGCPRDLGSAKPGSYDVTAKNVDVAGGSTNFLIQ